jgi:hypothetical protein
MLVRIVKDWSNPDLFRQSPEESGAWGDVRFTCEDVDECDLLVVLNRPHKRIKIRARESWLFSQESPIDSYKWHTKSFKDFDKVFSFWENPEFQNLVHYQTGLPWHINKTYDELSKLSVDDCDKVHDTVSWITSNASSKPGHRLRLDFLQHLKSNRFALDLFGRGFNPIDDKFDALAPYKYSLAIENYSCNDYWTEKIADCFLSWTMPIYYGAKNITSYFPKESMILIDPGKPEVAVQIIREAIASNLWAGSLNYVRESRDLILTKYQFFPLVSGLMVDHKIENNKRRLYNIPENRNPHQNSNKFIQSFKRMFNAFN